MELIFVFKNDFFIKNQQEKSPLITENSRFDPKMTILDSKWRLL